MRARGDGFFGATGRDCGWMAVAGAFAFIIAVLIVLHLFAWSERRRSVGLGSLVGARFGSGRARRRCHTQHPPIGAAVGNFSIAFATPDGQTRTPLRPLL